uniref:Open reading frame 101 n=1 Tax=Plasmodium coatneyi TaxID=208452 RepID=H7CDM7_9APIC|nr:open reading frame 101 [Plasmodium coatneyi]
MKLNIIKKYYYKKNKKLFKIIHCNFILNNYIIIKLNMYEYINNNLRIFTFKGIIINKSNKNNYIVILKYNNYDILYLYFYLNSLNLINIFKIGKFNI